MKRYFIIMAIIFAFTHSGCNNNIEPEPESQWSIIGENEGTYDNKGRAFIIRDKRNVDFWDGQYGNDITGKTRVYIADVQDGQEGTSQEPGRAYASENEIEKDT